MGTPAWLGIIVLGDGPPGGADIGPLDTGKTPVWINGRDPLRECAFAFGRTLERRPIGWGWGT